MLDHSEWTTNDAKPCTRVDQGKKGWQFACNSLIHTLIIRQNSPNRLALSSVVLLGHDWDETPYALSLEYESIQSYPVTNIEQAIGVDSTVVFSWRMHLVRKADGLKPDATEHQAWMNNYRDDSFQVKQKVNGVW